MDARLLILTTARELFNARGSAHVSTRHIAAEAGVSIGNVYYYFANREAIIRTLFDRMLRDWAEIAAPVPDEAPSVAALARRGEHAFELMWRYRFLYREMPVLMRRDAGLHRRARRLRALAERRVRELLVEAADAGLLALPADAREELLAGLTRGVVLVVHHWLPFEELGERPVDRSAARRGLAQVWLLLRPHLTPVALDALAARDPAPS